jgi:hypothetical protein
MNEAAILQTRISCQTVFIHKVSSTKRPVADNLPFVTEYVHVTNFILT